jgi:TonB family protein
MKVERTGVLRNQFTIVFLSAILVHDIARGAEVADQPQRFNKLDRSAVVSTAPIDYPYEARRGRITGSGVVVIEIDRTTGKVRSAYMAPSTGSSTLDYAALSSFRQWRFKPGTVSAAKIPITFTMGGPPVFEYRVKQKPMDEVLAHFLGKGVVLKGPIPAYPRFPPWTKKHGLGVYELHVQRDGTVAEAKILKHSGDDKFDRVAIDTLRKWRLRRGPLILELPLSFTLTPTSYSVDIPKNH